MSAGRRIALLGAVLCALVAITTAGCGRYGSPVRSQPQRATGSEPSADQLADERVDEARRQEDEARRREEALVLGGEGIAP